MLFTWVQATRGIIYHTSEDIWKFLADNTPESNMFCVFWINMINAVEQAIEEVRIQWEKDTD